MLSPNDWHRRFAHQAQWTIELRHYLYSRLNLDNIRRILDVGCGTGVITSELISLCEAQIFGLDIQSSHLTLAKTHASRALFTLGDAHQLPYLTGSFDLTVCHFLLLWVINPSAALSEMARVTQPGGSVMALAEPDYGGRVDYPSELSVLGDWQRESLRLQGADTQIGRRLAEIFHQSGLEKVEIGVLGGQWSGAPALEEWESEWAVLDFDLTLFNKPVESVESLEALKTTDLSSRQRGDRVLFVPTFYSIGQVPE